MQEEQFELIKENLLDHVRELFEEIEEEAARSHEEKYALLEDAVNNASDVGELRVAFEQWYSDHTGEMDLGYEIDEIWDAVVNAEV